MASRIVIHISSWMACIIPYLIKSYMQGELEFNDKLKLCHKCDRINFKLNKILMTEGFKGQILCKIHSCFFLFPCGFLRLF